MITVNKMGNSIVGSINTEQFGIPFTKEKYDTMIELQEAANNAATVEEQTAIIEEFKKSLEDIDYNTTIQSKCKDIHFNAAKGSYHLKVNDDVSAIAIPQPLVDRILDSMDKDIDFTPLIKLWTRWLRNPVLMLKSKIGRGDEFSANMFEYINRDYINIDMVDELMEEHGVSEEVALERATVKQVGITVEGLLKTFKVSEEIHTKYVLDEDGNRDLKPRAAAQTVDPDTGLVTYEVLKNEDRLFRPAMQRESGDAFFCGDKEGHFIKVGQRHYLSDWSKVNTDDHNTCVKGLHCGGLDYIKGYQSSGTETHNILVDPMHIGAVPAHQPAIRVLEYYVLDAFNGVNGSIYHSSTYAAETDAQWVVAKAKIIENYGKLIDDLKTTVDSVNAL